MLAVRSGIVVGGGREAEADVLIDDGRIVDVAPRIDVSPSIDASGCYVAPGFIDLQINGAFGVDATTAPSEFAAVVPRLARFGVTACCPTVISCSSARRSAAVAALAGVSLGVHLEGPFLNPVRRGAHPPAALASLSPSDVGSGVSLVTLAPELPGALELVRALAERGVVVSAGHSDATAAELTAAIEAGITYITHLFNAMRPFTHRDPGIIGAALTDERVTCGLIADGIHVDPTAVRMAWRALGPDRLNLVSDAVAVLGADGGRARVGDVELVATEHGVREASGVLAGSDLALDDAVRNLVAWTGCTVAEAIGTVTSVPARVLGLTDKGVVAPGADADLVLLDRALHVRRVLVGGRPVDESMTG